MEATKVVSQVEADMKKALEHTVHEYATLHTGKASPAMVESVMVDAYGSHVRIRDIAAISTPDSRLIVIQPWDKTVLKPIEQAILLANIGLHPSVEGVSIRIPVPELSRERREDLIKVAHKMTEDGRIAIRAARQRGMDAIKSLQKSGAVSEDDQKRHEKEVQKKTDHYNQEIGKLLEAKEKELKQI
ncbi:MAG: Ribosome-recycling factor [Verrucomicrobia bacterium ADurb.Bin474]|nr:MAG: Ribosome-recycling factor [Verrucomicrobia bacterium ADurb.Bin474]